MYAIRKRYNVSAKRGMKILFRNEHGESIPGIITRSRGFRLIIRLKDCKRSDYFHPTYNITYLP